jgi:serine/threonine protein kinase
MSNRPGELEICTLLMEHPHKNIIKIYDVGEDYIDMELLNININKQDKNKIKIVMMEVKIYLQSLGIMYIDWKLDNIGISDDGEIKLFDFDGSGLINIETEAWIIHPPKWAVYEYAKRQGMVTPSEIDNYIFNFVFK